MNFNLKGLLTLSMLSLFGFASADYTNPPPEAPQICYDCTKFNLVDRNTTDEYRKLWGAVEAFENDNFTVAVTVGTRRVKQFNRNGTPANFEATLTNESTNAVETPTGIAIGKVHGECTCAPKKKVYVVCTQQGGVFTVDTSRKSKQVYPNEPKAFFGGISIHKLKLGRQPAETYYYLADTNKRTLRVLDSNFQRVEDRRLEIKAPRGYINYNVSGMALGQEQLVCVAHVKMKNGVHVPGKDKVVAYKFDREQERFTPYYTLSGPELERPYAILAAPKSLGLGDAIIVGNVGSGKITAWKWDGTFICTLSSRLGRQLSVSRASAILPGKKDGPYLTVFGGFENEPGIIADVVKFECP